MDSIPDEFVKDPERFRQHIHDQIEDMFRALDDDKAFCDQDIDSTIQYMKMMEKKFIDKFRDLENQLKQIREENEKISEDNKQQLQNEADVITDLLTSKNDQQAWKKFQDYEQTFEKRSTVIRRIPKLHLNETDIERYFSTEPRPSTTTTTTDPPAAPIQTTVTLPVVTTVVVDDQKQNAVEDTVITSKEEKRNKKVIETVHVNEDSEEVNNDKTDQPIEDLHFGASSRSVENQQTTTTTNETITHSSTPAVSSKPRYCLTNRLPPVSTPSNPIISLPKPQTINFSLNPVSHYQHERNKTLLMACSYNSIVLFKSQRNRLDNWQLGYIERGTQSGYPLEWHDGLIISMGCLANDLIYMFTERDFSIYSILEHRKVDSRILPRGNDDGFERGNSSHEHLRGIGTAYGKYWYHIYLNRSSHWKLSKNTLEKLVYISEADLTTSFPDVTRFIHLSVSEKRTYLLVQMTDLSYAVVFYPPQDSLSPIVLPDAEQPLSIYFGYSDKLKINLCFVNDPINGTLYIIINDRYIQSYRITAYAICYLAEKPELLIATDNAINSINLNRLNLDF